MIARLKGVLIEKNEQTLIVDVGGVGYAVNVTQSDADEMSAEQDVLLYTYDHIRENARELFGFTSHDAKALFELLLSVNGVGPKMALSLLSLGESRQIRQAIASGNLAYISGASGVGKRLAERLTVDLKDKVGVLAGETIVQETDVNSELVDALIGLGYNRSQAMTALAKVNSKADPEIQLKQALKEMR